MLELMDAQELAEWQAFCKLEQLDFEKKSYPWTDEEIWGADGSPEVLAEARSNLIDDMFFKGL